MSKYGVNFDALDAQMAELELNNTSHAELLNLRSTKEKLINPTVQEKEALLVYFSNLFAEKGPQIIYTLSLDEGEEEQTSDSQAASIEVNLQQLSQQPELSCICRLLYDTTQEVKIQEVNDTIVGQKKDSKLNISRVLYFLMRKIPKKVEDNLEIRISVLGNVDAGKSTILGVLTKNVLDNGRGSARKNIFKHKHEIESGRTSAIGIEIMGFNKKSSQVISGEGGRNLSWNDINTNASKVVVFHDLAGHEKYLKTTVMGLTVGQPEAVMLVVGANAGVIGMAKEHLGLTLALSVPVFVVVTKVDMCPENVLADTVKNIFKLLKSPGCRKVPFQVRNKGDVIASVINSGSGKICPIFLVSNVTGSGLNLVREYINILPSNKQYKRDIQALMEIRDIYSVPFVGTVVAGVVDQGSVHVNDSYWIGPDEFGQFSTTAIKTIQYNRVNVPVSFAGQSASFSLKKVARSQLRRGMVLLEKIENFVPKAYTAFEADILILYHNSTIATKYQAVLHCRAIRQTVKLLYIKNKDSLRSGDRATVVLKFMSRPEYLTIGSRIIFREGKTKGVGKITKLLSSEEEQEALNLGKAQILD